LEGYNFPEDPERGMYNYSEGNLLQVLKNVKGVS